MTRLVNSLVSSRLTFLLASLLDGGGGLGVGPGELSSSSSRIKFSLAAFHA